MYIFKNVVAATSVLYFDYEMHIKKQVCAIVPQYALWQNVVQ